MSSSSFHQVSSLQVRSQTAGALGVEGKAPGFGAGDLVAAGEVDGVEEALRPGLIGSVGGFQRGHSPCHAAQRAESASACCRTVCTAAS